MVTQIDVGRNQWRNKGRLRFPVKGLVFYAPLWNSQLSGSPFNAWNIDSGGVSSCTVTGATWGIQGRTFDGIDDKITFPDTGFPSGAVDRSLLMWVKLNTVTKNYQEFFNYGTVLTYQSFSLLCGTDPDYNKLQLGIYYENAAASTGVLVASVWTQIGFILSGTAVTYIINGASAGTGTVPNINTVLTGTSGQLGVGWNSSYISGTCGEAALWSRALSLLEAQNVYLATKWRYL